MFGRFLSVIILLALPAVIFGGEVSYSGFLHSASRSWNSAAGLPHDNVTSFYRDGNGLLWVGTLEGLARIDSKSSKIFGTNTKNAILSNKINDLTGCKEKVFAATSSGISEIDGVSSVTSALLEAKGIFSVAAFSDCTLFAAGYKEIYEIKSGKVSKLKYGAQTGSDAVTVLFSDGGTLYAGFASGAVRSYENGRFSDNLCPANRSGTVSGRASEGRIAVGTSKGSVFGISDGKCWKTAESPSHGAVTSVDFQGDTVVFTSGGELFFAENGGVKPCGSFCSAVGSVSKVMIDGDFVWLSGNRGMSLFYPGKFITYGRESGLFSEKVYALLEDSSGRVWVGTRGGGLFVGENGRFRYVKDRKGDIGRFVGGLFQDEDGSIIVGTPTGIVTLVPEKPNVFRKMKTENNMQMTAVGVIFRDRKGRLWAGGGGGSIYLNTEKGWHLLRKLGDDSDFVSSVAEDKAGRMWFATSKGVWQLDENDVFHETDREIEEDIPVSLFVDEAGVVFVGTMHGGVTLIFPDMKRGRVDSRKGLCSDTVLGMVGDGAGNIWFSTTNGVFSLPEQAVKEASLAEKGSVECVSFGTADGIRRPEATGGVQPSVLRRGNGDLLFPTLEGIAVLKNGRKSAKFDTAAVEENEYTSPVVEEKHNNFMWLIIIPVLFAGAAAFFAAKRKKYVPHAAVGENISADAPGKAETDVRDAAEDEEPSETAEEPVEPEEKPAETAEEPAEPEEESAEESVEPEEESAEEPAETAEFSDGSEETPEDIFDPAAGTVKPKYEKYRLDDEIAEAYAAEARELMKSKKLYKNPDLTMPELAKKLKLSTNTLSQVLNGCCGQTFYNFVNTYRLEEVISMMHDPEHAGDSVLELSFEAGFKSKSTFNSMFKKYTGQTPSEYRKNIGNQ